MTAVPHGALGNTETLSARPDTQERELEGHVRLAHTSAAPEASIRDGSRPPRGRRIVRRESGPHIRSLTALSWSGRPDSNRRPSPWKGER
jgi:hypothetical protein